MKPSVKRMVAKKYMDDNRDRRYEEGMYGARYDEDMRRGVYPRQHHEEWPEDPYRMAMDPDRDPNMRRGRSARTGRYISTNYNDGRNMPSDGWMDPVYDTAYPYPDNYRQTDFGFMPDNRRPMPIEPNMRRDAYDFSVSGSIADMGYGQANGKFIPMPLKMTRKMAEQWTEDMENADGSEGARWSYEEVKKAMDEKHIDCDPNEMFAILNSVYSDYEHVAKKFGVDKLDFYLDLAKAWIDDKDAVPNKATMYYKYVVKH